MGFLCSSTIWFIEEMVGKAVKGIERQDKEVGVNFGGNAKGDNGGFLSRRTNDKNKSELLKNKMTVWWTVY